MEGLERLVASDRRLRLHPQKYLLAFVFEFLIRYTSFYETTDAPATAQQVLRYYAVLRHYRTAR